MDTAGRAVLFAGCTVVIALLGMMLLGVSFLYGVAISASIGVLLVMLASLTLLPALLTLAGAPRGTAQPARAQTRRASRSPMARTGAQPASRGRLTNGASANGAAGRPGGRSHRAARRRPAAADGCAGAGSCSAARGRSRSPRRSTMLVIAAPAIALRLGSSDASNDPASQTTHRAYELLAQGFGAGLQRAAARRREGPERDRPHERRGAARGRRRARRASPRWRRRRLNPAGDVATITVYPRSSPQAYATTQLVSRLRDSVDPADRRAAPA